MKILGIETSCDETAVAVVEDGINVLSNIVATQIEEHRLYGGVVPEIASRRHCESIVQVANEALITANVLIDDIDAVAVTYAPGLIGALLVGVNFAKGISMSLNKPLIPVHHIRAHISANYIAYPNLKPPFLSLVISGGHTHIIEVKDYTKFKVLARTLDDAVGEAYDKAARAMGFSYPGGVIIDKASQFGKDNYKLPRPKIEGNKYDMSFSGLKTSVLNIINNTLQKGEDIIKENLSTSFQNAVCDILSDKLMMVASDYQYNKIVLAGGVAANSGIRARLQRDCDERGYSLFIPPTKYCGDNAAMVASHGYFEFQAGNIADYELNAVASISIE